MADVNLTLGIQLDTSDIAAIKAEVERLRAILDGKGGGSGTGGGSKATNEFAESLAKIKVAARDAETEFRRVAIAERDLAKEAARGTASLEQLQKAQEATKAAQASATSVIAAQEAALRDLGKESGRSAIELDKISIATKSMVEAQQRVKVGFVGMATALDDINSSTKSANNVLLEFGRGVGDAGMFALDFRMGLLAVGNNITQTADSMGRLISQSKAQAAAMHGVATATNTAKIAFSSLATSFMGANGIIFLINAAVTALTIWSQTSKKAADEGTDYLAEAIGRLRGEFERVNSAISDAQSKLGMIGGGDIEKTEAALERARKALAEQQAILENIDALDKERLKAAKEESRSLNEQLVSLSKKDPEYRKHEERAYTQLNLVKQLESGSTSVRLEQAKTVAAISQSVTQLEEKLKAQKQIKAVLGDEVDLLDKRAIAEKDIEERLKRRAASLKQAFEMERQIAVQFAKIQADTRNLIPSVGGAGDVLRAVPTRTRSLEEIENDRGLQQFNQRVKKLMDEGLNTEEAYRQANIEADRLSYETRLEIANNYFTGVNDLAQFATNIGLINAKKAFNIQKVASAGIATIDTIGAVQRTLADPTIPSLVVRKALAISQGIAGAARVAAILSTPFGGKGGRSQTDRTSADGGGGFREGFRTDPFNPANAGGRTAMGTASSNLRPPTQIIIQSQLNQEVLAYNVRQGDAVIRQQTTLMRSDSA